MKLEIPSYVKVLMNELFYNGYSCYVVGGAVRDTILNKEVHDYDLTTNAKPEEMVKVFEAYITIPTGLKHGTLTVLSNNHQVEVTTYRLDNDYIDHRHPTSVTFTDNIKEDIERRDFTINGFAYNDAEGLLDFFNGKEDLDNKIIRCIGNPEDRFEEDALRILRAIRFSVQLGFNIEEETKKAIFSKQDLLSFISKERIRDELLSTLKYPCSNVFDEYAEIFKSALFFFPNINPDKLSTLDNKENEYTKLALLLEDAPLEGAKDLLEELKLSKHEINLVLSYLKYKDYKFESRIDLKYFLSDFFYPLDDYLNYRKTRDERFLIYKVRNYLDEIKDREDIYSLKDLAINGDDVVALGYRGSEISQALNKALALVIEEKVNNNKEDLIKAISE